MSRKPPKPEGAHAAQPGDAIYCSDRERRKGFYKSEVEREAFRQGLTVEEYGVYKGSVGSSVKPVNSAGGLLAISLLLTAINGAVWVMFIIHWVQAGPQEALKNTVPCSWLECLFHGAGCTLPASTRRRNSVKPAALR
ncbi:hypothetical protein AS189_04975 [Arthrobacter alpinus]|uniref:Uncharacterized protein n=1 Tax=Arthrobacter alpinus TaxID=656366 RepID=A0A0S2LX17_9MICC|nr:hypothetical protein [Arthrobacter alpinus]ALO65964.1 hypothetical protein AS189_04975 [Arthrobacter alpinus]